MAFGIGKPSYAERVQKTLGNLRFLYYKYIEYFKKTPFDLDDMIDGLIYIHLQSQKD